MNMQTPIKTFVIALERDALASTLAAACRFVEKRNSIPVLSNVLLTAGPEGLRFETTDLDVAFMMTPAASCTAPGAVTVNAHTFAKLVKNLPAGLVRLELVDDRLRVVAGRSTLELPTIQAEDFPTMATGKTLSAFTLSAATLRRLFGKARFAISTEATRYYLNGIFLNVAEGELRAVTTDGHRLARIAIPAPAGLETMPTCYDQGERPGIIIPTKTCVELLNLIKKSEADVSVTVTGGQHTRVSFSTPDWRIVSKIIDGKFPDYARVMPRDGDVLTFNPIEFREVLARVSAVSSRTGHAVKVEAMDGQVLLTMTDPENGAASEGMDAQWAGMTTPAPGQAAEPSRVEIGFNSKYIAEILEEIEGDAVRVFVQDFGSPVRIEDPADTGAVFVLMPMRV